jgi:stage II sporulation protein D
MAQYSKQYVKTQLVAKYPTLARLGMITGIVVTERSQYEGASRMTMVRLVGENGQSDMIRGEDLRLAIDPAGTKLRSTICQVAPMGENFAFFSGRGFGHGVGMCQYGTQGMAREGRTFQQILAYYYPNSTITKLY